MYIHIYIYIYIIFLVYLFVSLFISLISLFMMFALIFLPHGAVIRPDQELLKNVCHMFVSSACNEGENHQGKSLYNHQQIDVKNPTGDISCSM